MLEISLNLNVRRLFWFGFGIFSLLTVGGMVDAIVSGSSVSLPAPSVLSVVQVAWSDRWVAER